MNSFLSTLAGTQCGKPYPDGAINQSNLTLLLNVTGYLTDAYSPDATRTPSPTHHPSMDARIH